MESLSLKTVSKAMRVDSQIKFPRPGERRPPSSAQWSMFGKAARRSNDAVRVHLYFPECGDTFFLAARHNLTVLSRLPEASVCPSGANATEVTSPA